MCTVMILLYIVHVRLGSLKKINKKCSISINLFAVLPGKHEEGEKDVDEREEEEDDNEDEDDDSDTDTESEMKVKTTIKMDL